MLGVERHKLDLNVIVRAYFRTLSLKKSCLFGGVKLIFRKLRSYFNKDYVVSFVAMFRLKFLYTVEIRLFDFDYIHVGY